MVLHLVSLRVSVVSARSFLRKGRRFRLGRGDSTRVLSRLGSPLKRGVFREGTQFGLDRGTVTVSRIRLDTPVYSVHRQGRSGTTGRSERFFLGTVEGGRFPRPSLIRRSDPPHLSWSPKQLSRKCLRRVDPSDTGYSPLYFTESSWECDGSDVVVPDTQT